MAASGATPADTYLVVQPLPANTRRQVLLSQWNRSECNECLSFSHQSAELNSAEQVITFHVPIMINRFDVCVNGVFASSHFGSALYPPHCLSLLSMKMYCIKLKTYSVEMLSLEPNDVIIMSRALHFTQPPRFRIGLPCILWSFHCVQTDRTPLEFNACWFRLHRCAAQSIGIFVLGIQLTQRTELIKPRICAVVKLSQRRRVTSARSHE